MEVTVFCNLITEVISYAVFYLLEASHWVHSREENYTKGMETKRLGLKKLLPKTLNHSSIYGASSMCKTLG